MSKIIGKTIDELHVMLVNKEVTPLELAKEVIEELKKEIAQRDHQDMTREIAPLKQADDAVLVDSSDMTIDEVTEAIMNIIKERR